MRIFAHLAKAGVAAAAILVGSQAFALTITPAGPGLIGTSNDTSACEPGCFPAVVGDTTNWDLLYKKDVQDGAESGTVAGSYETTFFNSPSDPSEALIDYISGPSLVCNVLYKCILVVKDGAQTPAQYFFDLYTAGWNGTDDLRLEGFWPNQGAISHVSIWGPDANDCCERDVPEPGSLALLGFGLLGFALSRRRAVSR